ncbi:hypothetical protein GCM10009845_19590 [Pedococcus bigeumensis]
MNFATGALTDGVFGCPTRFTFGTDLTGCGSGGATVVGVASGVSVGAGEDAEDAEEVPGVEARA